ncbi:MAG: phosphatidylinositol kinase [Bacteroidetes bacterium GWF2_42_66]|nr:MAG: phosphatidylinositol kinase [Bacteroidetes bacterium GWA2_42_15]OFX97581.1 MAG: phosphatidylinositol kinase [Bacteroidetes bacterium GWE2_42_39]OFY43724.1 MAG: phosphatidylinositol kinase [Bacteroidetes bacterium GWF2_42_66]HBL76302.1 type II toxin-antitoxin system HipA family toxin [Prolixibacteraceae bacterium]HCR92213.1 type II toxin-antitoxin system HipA family toxin [Prolixibacteraceae bacterium]
MKTINKLFVSLSTEGQKYEVGELILKEQKIYFRYNSDFISSGLNLSPIKLPFNNEISTCQKEPFDGLFGVFNDSLPDGWGRLLLDRTLISKGIDISKITPLDRLAFVGSGGMGALIYQPDFEGTSKLSSLIELDVIAREMNQILQGTSSEIIEELFQLGGSSGGARPKIFVAYNPGNEEIIHGEEELPNGFENWIIKFPSSSDHPEIAKIEYAYHKMATKAGIEMSDCKLFEGKSGKLYFGTKRFDRIGNTRLHVHTASGLMHDNFRASTMDYGHLMDCAFRLERHVNAYRKVLRLAAFNVFSHNRDDHSKNFSFLMNSNGEWQFAPAYDLTFSSSFYGFHSTMVAGESQSPGKKHLLKLANHFGLKDGEIIIDEVRSAIAEWSSIAKKYNISSETIKNIQLSLNNIEKSN